MKNEIKTPLVMTFDFGTQSVRSCIIDSHGETLVCEKEKFEPAYFSVKPGYAEQDPDYYFECLCKCTKRIAENYPEILAKVAAVTLTCFRDSAVLLDENMKVLRPMVLWLDQRYAKCEEKLPLKSRALFALVGKTTTIQLNRRRTIANWIIENEPEIWAKTKKYIAVSTYFTYRLTGVLTDCASNFTGHYPIEYKRRDFYKNPSKHFQGRIFSVPKDKLCPLVKEGGLIGEISEEAAKLTGLPKGLKMFASGSDKSCETLGCGVIDNKKVSISLGTASSLETCSQKYVEPFPFLPAYPSVLPNVFNLDLQVYRGYWMINWFLKEFGAVNIKDVIVDDYTAGDYDKLLPTIPPGSDGVTLQPFWGSQLDKPEVKGAIVGFSDNTTKTHVYRAIIEGITYELRYGFERFQKRLHTKFTSIRISGGGSLSDHACQITADIMGVNVERVQTNETSSLGAAVSAFLSLGTFSTPKEAVDSMVRVTKVFTPDPKTHETYNKLYSQVYKKMYPALKDIYAFLYRYTAR